MGVGKNSGLSYVGEQKECYFFEEWCWGFCKVLQRHYQHLGKISIDSDFDANWKGEVESKVSSYGV